MRTHGRRDLDDRTQNARAHRTTGTTRHDQDHHDTEAPGGTQATSGEAGPAFDDSATMSCKGRCNYRVTFGVT